MKPLLERATLGNSVVSMLREPTLHRDCGSGVAQQVQKDRGRTVCLQMALASEKSTAVSRASRASHRSGDGPLVLAHLVLLAHWQSSQRFILNVSDVCSRRMTAQLDSNVRLAPGITAPGLIERTALLQYSVGHEPRASECRTLGVQPGRSPAFV